MNDWLRQFLFTHTRVTKPDGRPLYAYKCNDKKYAELKALTKETVTLALRGRPADQVEAIFCFYAAATFCREHEGGIWAWETVFKPLGIVEPDYQFIKNWVGTGLKWWGRPLIEQNGRRRFLPTIACEGGLPLQLLQKESAAINHFFRAVLESYHAQGCGGFEMAERLSHQQAYRLPVSLRQDVVFHLGGELIAAVVDLQGEIGNVPNPVVALDEKVPDWRNRLPLRLEEQTAEVLFNGLVKRSGELVGASHARLRWRGKLQQTARGWRVEKRLELPEKISAEQLCQWLGQASAPSRVRLLLTTQTGTEVIAWLTLSGTGDTARYRREWLKREGLGLFDSAVMAPHALSLHDGQKEHPLNIQNGEPWGELPWLFVDKHSTGELEFLAEGSVNTRSEHAWVLAPEQLMTKAHENGHCEKLGDHLALKRSVYQVGGTVDLLTTDQERYQIMCQAATDSTANYSIVGTILNEIINQQPVYRGLPRIANNISNYRTQWRPVNNGGPWREGELDCAGRIWLRLQNAAANIEVFRRQVFVLPRAFRIIPVIGEGVIPGSYRLSGLMGASVTIDSGQHLSSIVDGIEVVCPLLQRTSLPTVIVSLHWATGSLTLNLPYPQRGAIFQLAGQMLERDDCIPLDRLGGLRLLLQDHIGGQRYQLKAELITTNSVDVELPCLRFRDHLPSFGSGRCETTLLVWQDRIASLLNSSRCLDAYIRLDVVSAQGECLARLQIARFDCFLEQPNYSAYLVSLSADNSHRLGDGWQQRIRLEMIPLWAPTSAPLSLEVNPERAACWSVPDDLPDGPWWIIGRDGDWARFRPLLWVASNRDTTIADENNTSLLVAAIREPDREQRELLLVGVLQELGKDPDHPDWPRFFDLIRLSGEFPASSLDVLTRLVCFPQTLALALLKADDELFACVWGFAEQMPFSWSLLSVHCWLKASRLYFKSLSEALGELDTNGDLVFSIFQQFRERTTSRRGYWSALCDWLQEALFSERPLQNSLLQIARMLPAFFDEQIAQAEQDLQGRHDAEEQWPQSAEVMQRAKLGLVDAKHQYQRLDSRNRPVRCAPFAAARLSINSRSLTAEAGELEATELAQFDPYMITDNLIYELRLLRLFDTEWFDRVYSIALTVELSRLPLESA